MFSELFQWLTHIDSSLGDIISHQGGWTYLLLGATMFLETGVLIMPFLPGDTLLFAVGTFASNGALNGWLAFSIMAIGATAGDSMGYVLGCLFRDYIAAGNRIKLINPDHLQKTQAFYAKHGAKAIMLARFIPVVRCLAPFTAGLARMPYPLLLKYSLVGSAMWVGSFVTAGYFLGQYEMVRKWFPIVAMIVIGVTIIGLVREVLYTLIKKPARKSQPEANTATDVATPGAAESSSLLHSQALPLPAQSYSAVDSEPNRAI